MTDIVKEKRLIQLKALLEILADEIDQRPGARDLGVLARQYRETLKEIEAIEKDQNDSGPIAEILAARSAAGDPGVVRRDRRKSIKDEVSEKENNE